MTWPAVKRGFNQESFRLYVESLRWAGWRPSKIVWHNTAAPSLAQWIKSAQADLAKGLQPGISRINSLENFFRDNNHWSGCPHLFVANDFIWVMNPLTAPGVHSPSWNSTSIGIEMIADFDREDPESGEGLKVKNNTIFATAILCSAIGIEPTDSIFWHRQDPKTTHACPGEKIIGDKQSMIESVADLMTGGEHSAQPDEPAPTPPERNGFTTVADLAFRRGPGVDNPSTGSLPIHTRLTILDQAPNGTSTWLKVRSPAGYIGWVAGKFVKQEQA